MRNTASAHVCTPQRQRANRNDALFYRLMVQNGRMTRDDVQQTENLALMGGNGNPPPSVQHTNETLLKLLGLDHVKHIISADIALRLNELPVVTLQLFATDPQPRSQRPFDMEGWCLKAQGTLRKFIEQRALLAGLEMAAHSVEYDRKRWAC